jgi:succinate-semialdehyde dehydrogenase/glutarate-semialdehyde dehydrogenase
VCDASHRTRDSFGSRGEIAYAASSIEWFGEEGKRIWRHDSGTADKRIVVTKER